MLDPNYDHTRETLANYLEDFKQLEQDEPEVAHKLGFAGYVQYATQQTFGNEQHELLQLIADNPPQVLLGELGKIKSLLEKVNYRLESEILESLETLTTLAGQ